MAEKSFMKKPDYDRGEKRLNLRLNITQAEMLSNLASKKGIMPSTYAKMILIEGLNREKSLYPVNILPGQQHLFERGKKKGNSVKI
jgi:hypothetical protein